MANLDGELEIPDGETETTTSNKAMTGTGEQKMPDVEKASFKPEFGVIEEVTVEPKRLESENITNEKHLEDVHKVTNGKDLSGVKKLAGKPQFSDVEKVPGEQHFPNEKKVNDEQQLSDGEKAIGAQELPGVKKLAGKQQLSDVEKETGEQHLKDEEKVKGKQQYPNEKKVTGERVTGEQQFPNKEKVTGEQQLEDVHKVTNGKDLSGVKKLAGKPQFSDVEKVPGEQQFPDEEKVNDEQQLSDGEKATGAQELPGVKKLAGKKQFSDVEEVTGEEQFPNEEKVNDEQQLSDREKATGAKELPGVKKLAGKKQLSDVKKETGEQHLQDEDKVKGKQQYPNEKKVTGERVTGEQQFPNEEKVTGKQQFPNKEKVTGEQQFPNEKKVTDERVTGEPQFPNKEKVTGKQQFPNKEKVTGEQQFPNEEKVTGAEKNPSIGENSDIEELVCPVCLDTYRKPRTLTGCLHTFCEDCLIEYIFQTAKDSDGISFQCPICRNTAQGPCSKSKITDWVQNQPVNHVINSLIEKNSKKLVDFQEIKYSCEPCMSQDTEKEARHFCVECGESLCKECVGYHRHLKKTRNHNIVSYDDVGNDPEQAINLTMSLKCNKHPEKDIEFFCKDENELCCISCATIKHRKCSHVLEITQLDNEFDDTVDALTAMSELKQSIESMNDLARRNDEAFKHDLERARFEFQKFKDDVISKMNVIEGKIKKKCTALELGSDSVITDILRRNNGVSSAITASTTQLENVAAHGTSVQKFVALHRTRDQIMEYKRALDANSQGLRCQEVSLKIRHISSALLECEYLADINVEEQHLGAVHSLDKLRRCQTNVYLMKLKWTKMKLLNIQKDLKMREDINQRPGPKIIKAVRTIKKKIGFLCSL